MADVLEKLALITDPATSLRVQHALATIRRAMALYSMEQLAFSFNGGKDSTVLLHLLRAAIFQQQQQLDQPHTTDQGALSAMRSFVFTASSDFSELTAFIQQSDKEYQLHTEFLDSGDFKASLMEYIARTGVRAIILGTRRDDPNARDQQTWCPSSEGWAPFMRVNPVFDWDYREVWIFLRALSVPYCSLYDAGYTSLGSRFNTEPNRALQREDGTFSPAHLLDDGRLERAGRSSSKPGIPKQTTPAAAAGGPVTACALQQGSGVAAGAEADCVRCTAALVLIGDELLAGKVTDTSSHFLCQELRSLGYTVTRVSIIPDSVERIAEEVRRLTPAVEVLITVGGIGCTLDDVTVEGVALAFNRPLQTHPGFEARLRTMFSNTLTAAHLKMALVPAGAATLIDYELPTGEQSRFPILHAHPNIYLLPGVPHLMREKWAGLRKLLHPGRPFHNHVFRLSLWDETAVSQALVLLQAAIPGIAIGSYPVDEQTDGAQLLITLDSKDSSLLTAASGQLRALLPDAVILSEASDVTSLESEDKVPHR